MNKNTLFAVGASVLIGTLSGLLYLIGKGDGECEAYGHCASMLQEAAKEAKETLTNEG